MMLKLSNKSATTLRAAQRQLAAGMATATPRIGDNKVPMSLLEKDAYINY
jgi:aconitate hydratase